jgi:hypothetical protein
MSLIQLREGNCQFVWTHHHGLLDGWSISIIVREAFELYAAKCRNQHINQLPARPYSDYLSWRPNYAEADGERYWREQSSFFTTPISLGVERQRRELQAPPEPSYEEVWLSASFTRALEELAATHRVTMSTLFHAAWGLLLSRYSGEREVVFGSTIAGRPPDLAGSEHMVGLFINTLPVFLLIKPQETVIELAKRLQSQQLESQKYGYVPLSKIQTLSGVPRGRPLFNSIVVFENYPVAQATKQFLTDLKVEDVRFHEATN